MLHRVSLASNTRACLDVKTRATLSVDGVEVIIREPITTHHRMYSSNQALEPWRLNRRWGTALRHDSACSGSYGFWIQGVWPHTAGGRVGHNPMVGEGSRAMGDWDTFLEVSRPFHCAVPLMTASSTRLELASGTDLQSALRK